jgi:hypothetical protein
MKADFTYNPQTGEHLRRIVRGYAWVLRHRTEVKYVDVSVTSEQGAIVDFILSDTYALRTYWGSCSIAMHHINRWGFTYNFYNITQLSNLS